MYYTSVYRKCLSDHSGASFIGGIFGPPAEKRFMFHPTTDRKRCCSANRDVSPSLRNVSFCRPDPRVTDTGGIKSSSHLVFFSLFEATFLPTHTQVKVNSWSGGCSNKPEQNTQHKRVQGVHTPIKRTFCPGLLHPFPPPKIPLPFCNRFKTRKMGASFVPAVKRHRNKNEGSQACTKRRNKNSPGIAFALKIASLALHF